MALLWTVGRLTGRDLNHSLPTRVSIGAKRRPLAPLITLIRRLEYTTAGLIPTGGPQGTSPHQASVCRKQSGRRPGSNWRARRSPERAFRGRQLEGPLCIGHDASA